MILEHRSIICAGYSAVCHIHTVAEEVSVKALICLVDKKTNEKSKVRPRFVKQDQIAIMRLEAAGVICMEPFKDFPQMGRFTLRDEGAVKYLMSLTHFGINLHSNKNYFRFYRKNNCDWQSAQSHRIRSCF